METALDKDVRAVAAVVRKPVNVDMQMSEPAHSNERKGGNGGKGEDKGKGGKGKKPARTPKVKRTSWAPVQTKCDTKKKVSDLDLTPGRFHPGGEGCPNFDFLQATEFAASSAGNTGRSLPSSRT